MIQPDLKDSSNYHSPTITEEELTQALANALAMGQVLVQEFRKIRNSSLNGASWGANLESLLAHLEIDLDWLTAEFKKIGSV